MRVGTRSLLFGAHCVPIHTLMIALAWWRLYGAPLDLRLWCAFVVHDFGYFGCPEMDGAKGECHPALGGRIMRALFGPAWGNFTAAHSRFYAAFAGLSVSDLCAADKLATALEPWWLYLPRAWASGELREYMDGGPARYPAAYPNGRIESKRLWFANLQRDAFAKYDKPRRKPRY